MSALARLRQAIASISCRLAHDRNAASAVEFGMVLPLLVTLYAGAFIVSDIISCDRKVTIAAREMTDMSTHNKTLTASDAQSLTSVQTLLAASQQVLSPYNVANAISRLSEVQVVDATHVKVVWSQSSDDNNTALAQGTPLTVPLGMIPANLIPADPENGNYCSLNATSGTGNQAGCIMLGEISYKYVPPITLGNYTSINLGDYFYMFPRLSSGIPLE